MSVLRIIISFKLIGILLCCAACLVYAERYIMPELINQGVQHVNKIFVSTTVKSAIKCASISQSVHGTSFTYGEKLVKTSPECISTTTASYTGRQARTAGGETCQHWNMQSPHSHPFNSSSHFPDASIGDAKNFCRNPQNFRTTIGCYTTNPDHGWRFCAIDQCGFVMNDKGGFETDSVADYTGKWDMTTDNRKCKLRNDVTPKPDPAVFPDDTLEDATNYCRDPDGRNLLWCYPIVRPKDIRCSIDKCPAGHVTCYDGPTVRSYMGTWNKTTTGRVCQRWDRQEPHYHSLTADMFEEDTLSDAENFCRDPTGSGELWCYTTDPNTPTESCGIGHCSGATTCQVYKDETLFDGPSTPQRYTREH